MTSIDEVQLGNKKVFKPAPHIQSILVVHPLIEEIIAKKMRPLQATLSFFFLAFSQVFFLFTTLMFNNFDMKHFEHLKPI